MDISALRERPQGGSLTVTELNNYIKGLVDSNRVLNAVSVVGEISNFTDHRSGHLYFSLKDKDAQIKAVMFRSARSRLKFYPEEGMRVTVHGSVSLYQQTGSVQLYVNTMSPDGVGALYKAYEQLKERLAAEGMFDDAHKRPLPPFPERVGVITSPTGAAVRDIINVTRRRYPMAKIYLYPSLVQGEGAEANLIKALDYLDSSGLVDVIIIGRGGGSIEDLWAFNSEALARRIFAATTPVISAVGHETDFTICDFVSDLRAPTPSAAAELSVPDARELMLIVDSYADRIAAALLRTAERKRERLERIIEKPLFSNPSASLELRRTKVSDLYARATTSVKELLAKSETRVKIECGRADALSPLAVLSRGYSVVCGKDGAISNVGALECGDEVLLKMRGGEALAQIKDVKRGKNGE